VAVAAGKLSSLGTAATSAEVPPVFAVLRFRRLHAFMPAVVWTVVSAIRVTCTSLVAEPVIVNTSCGVAPGVKGALAAM